MVTERSVVDGGDPFARPSSGAIVASLSLRYRPVRSIIARRTDSPIDKNESATFLHRNNGRRKSARALGFGGGASCINFYTFRLSDKASANFVKMAVSFGGGVRIFGVSFWWRRQISQALQLAAANFLLWCRCSFFEVN